MANYKAPPANGASLDIFLMANWAIYTNKVTGKQLKVGQYWNFFGQNHLKFYIKGSHFYEKFAFISKLGPQTLGCFWQMGGCQIAKSRPIWKIIRVTESQTPKETQYMGGWNFFVSDFNKLPYSLRLQGDKMEKLGIFLNEVNDS